MKKTHLFAIILCFLAASCDKGNDPTPTIPTDNFMNMKSGSTWNYEVTNNTPPPSTSSYMLTSTNRDSTIGAKQYHIYLNSGTGASEYYFASGTDYYTYQSLPAALGGTKVENLYLKAGAAINTTWAQTYNITYNSIPLAVTVTNKIEAKGLSRTVSGNAYNNVIHVSTVITVAGVSPTQLTTDIDYYFAPNYGMIENNSKIDINYFGIVNNSDFTT
ncbi:MAG TPA: hypothetical protein VLR49_16255, partial [Ferruginibacter sp.]|nr:hypothetical protein [Ferruginibacter sp.]